MDLRAVQAVETHHHRHAQSVHKVARMTTHRMTLSHLLPLVEMLVLTVHMVVVHLHCPVVFTVG